MLWLSFYGEYKVSVQCYICSDSGPGIAPELYDHILKRFYRVHHHLEVGSGLGLSIVDKAAEKIGAKLHFGQSTGLGGLQVQVIFKL